MIKINNLLIIAVVATISILFSAPASAYSYKVNSYYKKSSGTYVQSYYRTSPNTTRYDNYSTKGNYNPYTGKKGYTSSYKSYTSYRKY